MHEYSLMKNIMDSILENLKRQHISGAEQIKHINLEIGALEIHSEESFKQAFEVLIKDTILNKAGLNLKVIPARIECPKCGYKGVCQEEVDAHNPSPCVACPSCTNVSMLVGGRGVQSIDLTLV